VPNTDSTQSVRLGPFRTVLLAALLLSVATYSLGYLFSFLINPLVSSGLLGTTDPFQIFSLVESILLFVFNPVLCLLVFYRIGGFSRIRAVAGYFGFFTYAFVGSAIGYVASLLVLIGIESVTTGYNIFTPGTDWLTLLGNIVLGTARGGVDMALIAFGGVMVARLRSGPQPSTGATVEPAGPSTSEKDVI
jgi:hypothetical protein